MQEVIKARIVSVNHNSTPGWVSVVYSPEHDTYYVEPVFYWITWQVILGNANGSQFEKTFRRPSVSAEPKVRSLDIEEEAQIIYAPALFAEAQLGLLGLDGGTLPGTFSPAHVAEALKAEDAR